MQTKSNARHKMYRYYEAKLPKAGEPFLFEGKVVTDPARILASLPNELLMQLVPLEKAAHIMGLPMVVFDALVRGYYFPNIVHIQGDQWGASISEVLGFAEYCRDYARENLDALLKGEVA